VSRLFLVVTLVTSGVALATSANASASMNPAPIPLMVVRVNDSSTVYVVTTSNEFEAKKPAACGSGCFLLRQSTDDGALFRYKSLPRIHYESDSLTGNLDQLVFATADDGYALMGVGAPTSLYVTLDGAGSWRREVIARNTTILGFTATTRELYAVIANCSKSLACTHYQLARSTLTARTWSFVPLPEWPTDVGVGMGAYGSTVWLTQQSTQTVWLLTSHDQGTTFTRKSAPEIGSVYACRMTATSSMTLWADCPTGMAVSFLFSGDGGTTWNRVPDRQFSGTGGGFFDPVSRSLAYLDFGPADSPGSKNLYRITNDGLSVKAVGKLPCKIADGLVFIDAQHGFAACDQNSSYASTVFLQTSNGGVTWKKNASFYDPFAGND
jgi:photosystem II stability/assembly factor-like uncharacterized protein